MVDGYLMRLNIDLNFEFKSDRIKQYEIFKEDKIKLSFQKLKFKFKIFKEI